MAIPKVVASCSEVWVAWGPWNTWLVSEGKEVFGGQCPFPVKSVLTLGGWCQNCIAAYL